MTIFPRNQKWQIVQRSLSGEMLIGQENYQLTSCAESNAEIDKIRIILVRGNQTHIAHTRKVRGHNGTSTYLPTQ